MRKIFVLTLGLVMATVGCNEIENTKPDSSLAPAMITGATATGYNGGIRLTWTNPEDSRFGYVKIDYTDPSTQEKKTARAVYPATSWDLVDVIPADGEISFTLLTVSEAGVFSTASPLTVSATPTLPPVVTDLVATPGPGRITLEWTNPSDPGIDSVMLSYIDPRPGTNQGKPVVVKTVYATTDPVGVTSAVKQVLPEYGNITFTVTVIGTNGLRSPEATVTATALAPVAPQNVTELAAIAGKGEITLSWINPTDDDRSAIEISYVDPREESATQGQRITESLSAATTSYRVTELMARYGEVEFTVATVNVFDLRSETATVRETSELGKMSSKLPLTADMIYVNTSAEGYDGGGPEAMLDGDTGTYWHSAWSPQLPLPYVLQVRLPKKVTQISFKATSRNHGNNYAAKAGEIWLGDYGTNLTKVADVTESQTSSVRPRGTFSSPVYAMSDMKEFDTFRFVVTATWLANESWSLAEFEVYELVDEEPES